MNNLYQPYSTDTAHLVPVSRTGNRPTNHNTSTTTTRADTVPRIIDGTIVPSRADLLAELHSSQPTSTRDWSSTFATWAYRTWIGFKALAVLAVLAAVAAVVYLIVTVVMWFIAHLAAIIAVLVILFLCLGGGAAAKHCPGCRG